MREIKFRGKRKEDGAWVYGDLVHKAFDGCDKVMDIGIKQKLCFPVEVDPETVGQFTGLKDKNGKEIWEGDILQFTHMKKTNPFVIEWDNKSAGWTFFAPKDKTEVIGNIFDIPGLLAP